MVKPKKHTVYFVIIGVVVLLALGGLVLGRMNNASKTTSSTSQQESSNTVNYGPPTSEEQKAGDEQKQTNAEQAANTKTPTAATVVISNTSQSGDTVRVRAFVSNAVEDGGTCTTTLTHGNLTVTKQTNAFSDASTTQCGAIDFTRDQFATSGTWQISVTYASSSLKGSKTGSIDIR